MLKYFSIPILLFILSCSSNKSETIKSPVQTVQIDSIVHLYKAEEYVKCIELGTIMVSKFKEDDRVFHILSSSFLALGKDSMANIFVKKALELNPKNHVALTNKGIIFDKNREYDQAKEYYLSSLESNDTLPQTYSNFMLNRIRVGDFEAAVSLGEKALIYGGNIWDKANLCFAYHKIGNNKKRNLLWEDLRENEFSELESLEKVLNGK